MATIQNDNANKNALESLNNSFDTELHKNKKYKWYSPRIGNLVIPQVYDDSLSYYEAINKLQMLIHAEIARAITAENLLGANLDKEIQRAKQAESDLNDALNAEIARAKAEEKRLDNKIDAETDRAKAAEKTITDNLNAEIERAKAAEEALTNALNSEIDRAKAAEKKNADAIVAETTRATNAENALGDRITAETTARQNADKTLDDKITKEVSDRQGADSVLDNKITAEADARKAADTTINQNITNVQNSVNTLSGKAVTDVAMTEENGTYTLTQEKNGVKSNIGTIDLGANNPVVEVKDSVVENTDKGYDFHTIGETTNDGTENTVGQFYLAQKQITNRKSEELGNYGIWHTVNEHTIDQSGKETDTEIFSQDSTGVSSKGFSYTLCNIFGVPLKMQSYRCERNPVYNKALSIADPSKAIIKACKKGSIVIITFTQLSHSADQKMQGYLYHEFTFKQLPLIQIAYNPFSPTQWNAVYIVTENIDSDYQLTEVGGSEFSNLYDFYTAGIGGFTTISYGGITNAEVQVIDAA